MTTYLTVEYAPGYGISLLTAKNCYITPHIAWASAAARERLMQIMLDNVKAFLDGKVINAVTK